MPPGGLRDGMTVLNVAEKNDAAKCLAQIMSRGTSNRREGFSKFNKIYEFNYNLLNYNCTMVMTSVSGHLYDQEFGGLYKNWKQTPPVQLFEAPITRFVPDNFKNIQRTLEREVRKCQVLVIWTDGDREGENIGFEIIECCQKVKPNIQLVRARFSEITPRAVQRACQNLVDPDRNMSAAVDVRRELDLRIGAAFTRFQTLRLQRRFPEMLDGQLISYGSCQFPTLGFVVERYKQVEEFVPECFYKIKVTHNKDGDTVDFNWKRGRVFNERVCRLLCGICQENPTATVLKVTSKPKSKWRPLPLDTVEMEKSVSRKLRINAKEVMKVAEKLYTQGIISYPRTETNIFPKGMNLAPLVESQIADPNWGGFARGILENGGPNPRQGKKTDNAHPPIHPLRYANNLQGNEKRIYEFIVRHFLACLSKDAQGKETSVEIDIAGEKFSAQGLTIIARNYLEVYPYDKWNSKTIPEYNEGDTFIPDVIETVESETRPPPLLTEADLIGLMEKFGIGTDATHAEHIETIKNRNYVGVQGDGTFLPGMLGMGLVEGYDGMGFAMSKPYLRAALEEDLKRICDGTKRKDVVLEEQIRSYREVFIQAKEQVEKLDQAVAQYLGAPQQVVEEEEEESREVYEKIRKCPKCNANDMVLKKTKAGGWMLGCMGYPACKNSKFLPKFVLNASKSDATCVRCQPPPVHKINLEFKRGSVPPMIPNNYVGCIGGCDQMLADVLDVPDFNRSSVQHDTNTRSDNHNSNGNRYGSNNRGNTRRNNSSNNNNSSSNNNSNNNNIRRNNSSNNNTSRSSSSNNNNTSSMRGLTFGPTRKQNKKTKSNNQPQAGASNSAFLSGNSFQSNQQLNKDQDGSEIACDCGKPAIQLTVRKEGPNQGKLFYKCGQVGNQCRFFLWHTGQEGEQGSTRGTFNQGGGGGAGGFSGANGASSFNNRRNNSSNNDDRSSVVCKCNQPAPLLTVQKEGVNKGRQFYGCGKPRDSQCGFFQWADEDQSGSNFKKGGGWRGGRGGRGSRGGNYGGGGNKSGTKRKCGGCGQEGHTKRSCPFMK